MSDEAKKHQPPAGFSSRLFAHAPVSSAQAQWLLALQQKLQQLCGDHNYTFSIKRPQASQLLIQFTAVDSVVAETEEIRKELVSLIRALQKLITDVGIPIKPNQFKPDWRQWTLTIQAEPAQLDQLANLLHTASRAYLPSDAKTGRGFFQSSPVTTSSSTAPSTSDSETLETTCGIQ